jgi:hypothetical protein
MATENLVPVDDIMSMAPNNPFQDPENTQAYAPAPSGSRYKGCLIGCAIAGTVSLLVCCGGGYFLTQTAFKTIAAETQRQLADDPVILEHIGEIESIEISMSGIIEEAQKAGEQGGEGKLVFEIEGSKGSGQLILDPNQAPGSESTLVMPDGSRHTITSFGQSEAAEDAEFEINDFVDEGEAESAEGASNENASEENAAPGEGGDP